jgi:hypothetical protein
MKPVPRAKPAHLSGASTAKPSAGISKRGLPWPWDSPGELFSLYNSAIAQGKVTWLFNWELWVPPSTPAEIEWVPCVRTAAQVKDTDPFLTDITTNQGRQVRYFLGFNEPEIPDQANLNVGEAVQLWRQHVLPAKQKFGFRLGSPGMSSDVSRSKPWLDQFFAQLGGSNGVDFLVLHWYGRHFGDMQRFLEQMHAAYNLPIWLNEFACSNMGGAPVSADEVAAFIGQAIGWLDQCPWIERYAYFGHGQGKTVGNWVGTGSNFCIPADGHQDSGGMALTRVGMVYMDSR